MDKLDQIISQFKTISILNIRLKSLIEMMFIDLEKRNIDINDYKKSFKEVYDVKQDSKKDQEVIQK